MATYSNSKTLNKAVPTVRTSDDVVKSWEIEVILTHTREDETIWSHTYRHNAENLESLGKTANQYTAAELIGFLNSNIDDIFDAHYEAHNTPPEEDKVLDFDINNLSS
jgi:hypothetical protein